MFFYISCKDDEQEGPYHHYGREGFPSMPDATTNLLQGHMFLTPILEARYVCCLLFLQGLCLALYHPLDCNVILNRHGK